MQTTLERVLRYWGGAYDWRKIEARLNVLSIFMTEIDELGIHFIHVRPRHENAALMIPTHGWPGSVLEFLKVIAPLTDPTAHSGKAEDAFHLDIPSVVPADITRTLAAGDPAPATLTSKERGAFDQLAAFYHDNAGYAIEMNTRPPTIDYTLVDSSWRSPRGRTGRLRNGCMRTAIRCPC